MTPEVTRMLVEVHFAEPVESDDDDIEALPLIALRNQLGQHVGTTRIIDIQYPEPHIVRIEVAIDDVVLDGSPAAA